MWAWITLLFGSTIIAGGVGALVMVDRRWRSVHLECCRCLQVWFGRDKLCTRCGASGHSYDWLARKYAGFPTHDWQGYLDTGPIRQVVARPADHPIPTTTLLESFTAPRPPADAELSGARRTSSTSR